MINTNGIHRVIDSAGTSLLKLVRGRAKAERSHPRIFAAGQSLPSSCQRVLANVTVPLGGRSG